MDIRICRWLVHASWRDPIHSVDVGAVYHILYGGARCFICLLQRQAMNVVPVLLIKNEEIWIERVLRPLVEVFGCAIVSDTGSTDTTMEQVKKVKGNVLLRQHEDLSPAELGQCRAWMQEEAKKLFDATHIFLVDGDELYPTKYLNFIKKYPMPETALSGFTWGIECTELDNGECWLYNVGLNRQAMISVDSKWSGLYPFESPDTYRPGDPSNYYWRAPDPSYRFYHIHQMKRSSRDGDVYLRLQKRYQFSMKDAPEIKPHKLWLNSQKDYQDE
jgi:hypothetical protein